ncbi:MAG TPA: hypothetical protein DIT64_17600 [Verrucomicrobiales bacterium]|nr:hypothetical protein [Verrucomicrobiales bacterium]
MKAAHKFLITCCVAGIYACGFFTAWLVKERRVQTIITTPSGARSTNRAAAEVLGEMRAHLLLTDDQVAKLEPLLNEWEKRVTRIDERRLAEKLDLFRELIPDLRTHLTSEQQVIFDDVAERVASKQRRLH